MLNAFASLKCSKKCQHNVQKPNHKHSFIIRPGLQTRSKYLYVDSYTLISRTHKPCFFPPRGFPTRLKYLFYLSRTKTLCLLSNSLRSCVLPIIPLCLSRAKEAKKKLRLISGYLSNVCGCKNLIVLTQLPFIIS